MSSPLSSRSLALGPTYFFLKQGVSSFLTYINSTSPRDRLIVSLSTLKSLVHLLCLCSEGETDQSVCPLAVRVSTPFSALRPDLTGTMSIHYHLHIYSNCFFHLLPHSLPSLHSPSTFTSFTLSTLTTLHTFYSYSSISLPTLVIYHLTLYPIHLSRHLPLLPVILSTLFIHLSNLLP